ncbi:hypothetical protein [Roseicella sp. DB1501]|uniref:hypothetical protein n=1 Tax=Roseicella sp. DB1501 TaxID=2730925 RepID=UPI001492ED35|nr:hypothetical protein [Roseicella sp. DB1501]NOG69797.1 hypothetical protein [Roseicella sp. DB1501]
MIFFPSVTDPVLRVPIAFQLCLCSDTPEMVAKREAFEKRYPHVVECGHLLTFPGRFGKIEVDSQARKWLRETIGGAWARNGLKGVRFTREADAALFRLTWCR